MLHLFNDQAFQPSTKLFQKFMELTEIETHPKGTVILNEGDICRKLYLIQSGLIRVYYYQNGNDVTHWFIFENHPVTELASFYNVQPSDYFFETLEETTVMTLSLENLNYLLDNFPSFERLARTITTNFLLELGEKVKDLQFRTATERYHKLIEQQPKVIERASLGHIASFLGITQQSLSRIRNQFSK